MRPLSTALACLLAVPSSAQVVGEAASAVSGASSVGAVVSQVPGGLAAPAMSPALAPGLQGALLAPPAVAPAPGAPAPALAPSLITPIDPAALPDKGKNFTPAEWGKLVASSKDEGTKAVLRSMAGDNPGDPQLTVKLKNGESVSGAFRGLADGKMVFSSGGKLLGLGLDSGNIAEITRSVDLIFDGSVLRPAEMTVFGGAPVVDPFKDLAAYKGRILDVDVRDLDDLKYSAQSFSGRLVKADGEEIQLVSAAGTTHIQKQYHRLDAASLRTEHYSSYGKISSIADVEGKIPAGAPVELIQMGGKKVLGRFGGVRRDSEGAFVVIETEESGGSRFRAFRDFHDLRTRGYDEGALLPGSEPLYANPAK
ncbi:MAG: hypothetical protein NDJ72_07660 [Elusimicrobia bacterium]|nr:hypothetical protein [Elusimicrobiota bacterium]